MVIVVIASSSEDLTTVPSPSPRFIRPTSPDRIPITDTSAVARSPTQVPVARGSPSSDITENRSFINSVTGIAASLQSQIVRNVTYSNILHGIHTDRFSGLIDHNLVYSTGYASINVEGPGTGAVLTHNTVYEPCPANDELASATTVTTGWEPKVFMEQLFPPAEPKQKSA